MTTVIDPLGTPSVVYNQSGATLIALDGNGATQGSGTVIPRSSVLTIVLGTVTSGTPDNQAFVLPTDGDIGDVVEFHSVNDSTCRVFAGDGQTINGIVSTYYAVASPAGVSFRQISETEWAAF